MQFLNDWNEIAWTIVSHARYGPRYSEPLPPLVYPMLNVLLIPQGSPMEVESREEFEYRYDVVVLRAALAPAGQGEIQSRRHGHVMAKFAVACRDSSREPIVVRRKW